MFAEISLATIATAVEGSAEELNKIQIIELTFVVALVFIAIHIWHDRLHGFLYRSERIATSMSGGMAIAYVFMHLLPELEEGAEVLGAPIHLLALIGFLVFYGLQRIAWKAKRENNSYESLIFFIQLGFTCIYNFLLIYAMPEQFENGLPFVFLYVLAMGLHLLSVDRSLAEKHSRYFQNWGRYALIATVAAALAADIFAEPANELVSDTLLAILAGSLLFNIFQEELPEPDKTSFPWFLAGVITYLILLAGSWALHLSF